MTRLPLLLILAALASFVVGCEFSSSLSESRLRPLCLANPPSLSLAAPTFCKCTCFTNSTIIPLGPQKDAPASPPPKRHSDGGISDSTEASAARARSLDARAASSSCAQCNRAFCLNYNLPICKGAEEKDVLTSCFQRDSRKDQIIVWGFILGTAGLLGWAGIRRLLELREGKTAPFTAPAGRPGVAGPARPGGSRASGLVRRMAGIGGGGEEEDAGSRGMYSALGIPNDAGGAGQRSG